MLCQCLYVYTGVTVSNKLVVEGLSSYALSPSEPYKIAVYVPGSKVQELKIICTGFSRYLLQNVEGMYNMYM